MNKADKLERFTEGYRKKSTEEKAFEGWSKIALGKWHYFKKNKSLCGSYKYMHSTADEMTMNSKDSCNRCVAETVNMAKEMTQK